VHLPYNNKLIMRETKKTKEAGNRYHDQELGRRIIYKHTKLFDKISIQTAYTLYWSYYNGKN